MMEVAETNDDTAHIVGRAKDSKPETPEEAMPKDTADTVLKIVAAALVTAIVGYGLGRMDSLAQAPWLQERAEVYSRIDAAQSRAQANERAISDLKVLLESNNRIGNANSNRLTWMETVLQTMAENQGLKIPRPPSGDRN